MGMMGTFHIFWLGAGFIRVAGKRSFARVQKYFDTGFVVCVCVRHVSCWGRGTGRISLVSGRMSTVMTHASIGFPYFLVYMLVVGLWGLLLA